VDLDSRIQAKKEHFVSDLLGARSNLTRAYLSRRLCSIEHDFLGSPDGVHGAGHVHSLNQSIIGHVLVDFPPRSGTKRFKERHDVADIPFALDRGGVGWRSGSLEGVESARLHVSISFWGSLVCVATILGFWADQLNYPSNSLITDQMTKWWPKEGDRLLLCFFGSVVDGSVGRPNLWSSHVSKNARAREIVAGRD